MSAIYNLEPQPTASAIIHTTQGDVLVELFAKQTPLTCRNFLQLSLDGYYDNTIFHRLVPGFILQGGDPTGTGHGGESIYDRGAFAGDMDPWPMELRKGVNAGPTGSNFKDEFHSRLKFSRRGLLGMANEGRPDTNGSQFFFTLGKTQELTGKNTLFGRVGGDSIYNVAKMGEAEVEEGGERPIYPAKITSIEILVNPFDDMKKREMIARSVPQKSATAGRKQKKRKGGNKQLLSFGGDEGDGDEEPLSKKAKFDTRIVQDDDEPPAQRRRDAKKQISKPPTVPSNKSTASVVPDMEAARVEAEADTAHSRQRPEEQDVGLAQSEVSAPEVKPPKKSELERMNEEISALKASMKRTVHTEPVKERKKTALEQLIPETSTKGRKRRPGGNSAAKDDLTAFHMLQAFQSKLKQVFEEKAESETPAPASRDGPDNKAESPRDEGDEDAQVCDLHFIANCQSCRSWDKREAEEESGDEGWMAHELSFAADKLGKDLSYRKKAEEELVVIDPLEKTRTLKEEKKVARNARVRETGRAWDQPQTGPVAKATALVNRRAK